MTSLPYEPELADASPGRPSVVLGLTGIAVTLLILRDAAVPGFSGGSVGGDILFVTAGFATAWELTRGRRSATHVGVSLLKLLSRGPSLFVAAAVALTVSWVSSPSRTHAGLLGLLDLATGSTRHVPALLRSGEPSILAFWLLALIAEMIVVGTVVLSVAAGCSERLRIPVLTAVVSLLGLLSWFEWVRHTFDGQIVAATYLPQSRAWEFAAGALAALAVSVMSEVGARTLRLGATTGVAALVASVWLGQPLAGHVDARAGLPVVATGLALACGAASQARSWRWMLNNRFFRGLGTLGFSWYLWHAPLMQLAVRLDGPSPSWGISLEMELLALWAACLTYLLLQRPLDRTWRRERPASTIGSYQLA